ncbi:MAG: AraC family transcriptional regulator [Cytophagales bacterium]|nr:AraC family transcriptional regulator [Cytophagales bacterium]
MKETRDKYLESLNRAIQFIEGNLNKRILLKDIAQEAYLSEYHFHRIFKSMTGETVKDFIMRLRMEGSAIRLKHSKDDIGQIGHDFGFENHETYTRAFKRYFDVTPQDYRDSIHEFSHQKQNEFQQRAISLPTLQVEEPTIQYLSDMNLAYIRHTGSYNQVGASFQRLMIWAAAHLVLKWKPTTLGIVYDNPDLTEEDKIRFDSCVLVNKAIQPKGEIGFKRISGGKFAVFRYRGAYDNFYSVYDYIYSVCLFERGWELADKPALEWYIQSPPFYKPDNYLTDFYVPIK